MKSIVTFAFMTICNFSFAQNNLLDTSTWTVGSGSATGFNKNGTTSQNVRELGADPYGAQTVLWKAISSTSNDSDGGWYTGYHNIDHTKTYRFSVWIKKTNSNDGAAYFGLHSRNATNGNTTLELTGTAQAGPYFWSGDLPELDKWYLLIGYMHDSGHTGTIIEGGVYDGVTGAKVLNANSDFKFAADATKVLHRTYQFYTNNANDRQFFWEPAIYEVNGLEPSISNLLNLGTTSGQTVWNTSGNDINYTVGKVGIGTAAVPNDYLFAVNGKIISEELKVQLHSQWPDYVFSGDYSLPTLEEVEKHIQEKGHLINIPSANEVEINGIEVGEMNRLLLEKIEELTLYILELKQENTQIKRQVKALQESHK